MGIDGIENDTEDKVEEVSLRDQLEQAFEEAPSTDENLPQQDDDGQPRDERGRWTRAQQEHYEEQQRQQQEQEQAAPEGEPEIRLAPPPGWSPQAKAAYASLPPEVQEAVARREYEVNNGFRKLQEYKGLDEYVEIARNSGTTLKEALDRYRAAEDALDQDFNGGIVQLCQMYGVHPVQLAQNMMRAFGQGGPGRMPQVDPQSSLMAQRLAGMEETVRTLISEREMAEQEGINAALASFAEENLYFEDVRMDMADLIRSGRANNLQEAYEAACWMNPSIRDLLIKEQAAPQNTRQRVAKAQRASSGLRTGAPAGSPSGSSQSNNLRSALEEAWGDAQGL